MSESDKTIDIDYVAKLARLELSDKDKEKLSGQLNDILIYFEKLNSVDVDGIEPMAHAHKVDNVWREGDEPGPVFSKEVLKAMAPEIRDDQVVVPKVVE
jgi:aspartyl-tRNA(Asn)/glutamyl-tRNA(Gln) amidotransferase subunit C